MRFSTLGYSIKQGVKNIWRNKMSCHGNSLLLSSGKLLREGFVLLCQSDQRQNFRHALFDDAVRFLDDTLCECYVFIDIPVF